MSELPLSFRNATRYVTNVEKSVPLYTALGFEPTMQVEGFAILQTEGLKLVLHEAELPGGRVDESGLATALGFTVHDVEAARKHVEAAGWTCTREPDPEDMGLFWIYTDLDGNRINLVKPRA